MYRKTTILIAAVLAVLSVSVLSTDVDADTDCFTVTYVIGDTEISMEVEAGAVITPFTPSLTGHTSDKWAGHTEGTVAARARTPTAALVS
ncbi:MAG: hypothetical protein MJZ68_09985, partial [archaeon]|nr:hypothetical protein [archaeon]